MSVPGPAGRAGPRDGGRISDVVPHWPGWSGCSPQARGRRGWWCGRAGARRCIPLHGSLRPRHGRPSPGAPRVRWPRGGRPDGRAEGRRGTDGARWRGCGGRATARRRVPSRWGRGPLRGAWWPGRSERCAGCPATAPRPQAGPRPEPGCLGGGEAARGPGTFGMGPWRHPCLVSRGRIRRSAISSRRPGSVRTVCWVR